MADFCAQQAPSCMLKEKNSSSTYLTDICHHGYLRQHLSHSECQTVSQLVISANQVRQTSGKPTQKYTHSRVSFEMKHESVATFA